MRFRSSISPHVPVCEECDSLGILDMKYDSYFCPECLIWIEEICEDPNCSYCKNRPEFPEYEGDK